MHRMKKMILLKINRFSRKKNLSKIISFVFRTLKKHNNVTILLILCQNKTITKIYISIIKTIFISTLKTLISIIN